MAKRLCTVLRAFFVLQERHRISVHIDHVQGTPNDVADALSRDNPSDLGLLPSQAFEVDWSLLSGPQQLQLFRSADRFRGYLAS